MVLALATYLLVVLASPPSQARPPALPADPAIRELVERAIAAEDAGAIRSALELHLEVVRRQPDNVRSMNSVAGLYGTMQDFASEVTWAEKAISTDPGFALAYINLGNGLHGLGKVEQARVAFEKAAQVDPRSPLGVYSLGVLAEKAHDFRGALSQYQKSVEIDPTFANGYYNLGAAMANLGRFDEAAAAFKRVLELDPRANDARDMLNRVRQEAAKVRSPTK